MQIERIGAATLYCGDCLEIMPTLGAFDAVVTDPPYGIGYVANLKSAQTFDAILGDDKSLDLREMLALPVPVLSFGANNYPDQLPHRGCWLCWDKRTIDGAADGMMGSAFELAWSNKTAGFHKIVRVLHGGVVNADGGNVRREHPTQKPTAVMRAAILWAAKDAKIILDPFMGSGTTGVACANLGRDFIGIEIDQRYFDIACKRIEGAYTQPDLFIEPPAKPKQLGMLDA